MRMMGLRGGIKTPEASMWDYRGMENLESSPPKLPSRRERQRELAAQRAVEEPAQESPTQVSRSVLEYDDTIEPVTLSTGIIRVRHGIRAGELALAAEGRHSSTHSHEHRSIKPELRRGLHTSALTVLFLSVATCALWFSPWESWACAVVVALASCLLAAGWPSLTNTKVTVPAQVAVGLAGCVSAGVVTFTADLMAATAVMGLGTVGLVIVEVFTASTPRDYSKSGRVVWAARSTTSSLMSSMTALLLVVSASSWVTLASSQGWRIAVPIACVIVSCTVWGDQIGASFRSQSFGALGAALLSGVLASVAVWKLGQSADLSPIVLPGLAAYSGLTTAVVILGVFTGIAVALVVIVLDGFMGDTEWARPTMGAIARGSAKFLLAALPVYIMFRIGGI